MGLMTTLFNLQELITETSGKTRVLLQECWESAVTQLLLLVTFSVPDGWSYPGG